MIAYPLPGSSQVHWSLVDDLPVHAGPGPESRIVGTFQRGAALQLWEVKDGYCGVRGDGREGYVLCKDLSLERVARAQAGENGVDAAQRWVSGNAVTLRAAPRRDADVAGRLALNIIVKLLGEDDGTGYCSIQLASGQTGYTACRYLAKSPVVLAHVRGDPTADGTLSSAYDPERAFWLEPGWVALERYAQYLKEKNPEIGQQGPWPRSEALERMKAHLALGLYGPQPEPYADWVDLKRTALQNIDLGDEAKRLSGQGKKVTDAVWQHEQRVRKLAAQLQRVIGLWGPLHDAPDEDAPRRVIRLIRALEFSTVSPSMFRSETEVAPPHTSAQQASGRFGIVFRDLITPRRSPDAENPGGTGLYDMLAHTQMLARPIWRIRLFRDGRVKGETSLVKMNHTLWHDSEEPMCGGWIPGFSFGDADAKIWHYLDGPASEAEGNEQFHRKLNPNPRGSLFAFYTKKAVPREQAVPVQKRMTLDRAETGFIGGSYFYYDLDADGIADLAVWEGQGRGPGHLEGPTLTDDHWYRLALVNIDGAWKVLGSDAFAYGCGC